jgi:transcriptional regulator with XRE-family HTH domain
MAAVRQWCGKKIRLPYGNLVYGSVKLTLLLQTLFDRFPMADFDMQISATDSIVARRLRIFRVAKGFDLATLSEALKIDLATLERYENGMERIPPRALRAAADALKVSLHAFFDPNPAKIVRESQPEQAEASDEGVGDIFEVIELLEHFARVKDKTLRAEILKFVAFLAGPT